MLIVGLLVFVGYRHPEPMHRAFLATGAMLGFLSHLVLDEICAVDLRGVAPRLNSFAGSALKLRSKSNFATGVTYAAMLGLIGLAWSQHRSEASGISPASVTVRNAPAAAIPSAR